MKTIVNFLTEKVFKNVFKGLIPAETLSSFRDSLMASASGLGLKEGLKIFKELFRKEPSAEIKELYSKIFAAYILDPESF